MLTRSFARLSLALIGLGLTAHAAMAQRPPSGNQGPPQMSFERAWAWLMARPGVLIAIAIALAAIVYMIISKRKSRT